MRDHLVAIQEIVQGVATNDFDAIEKAAKRIGYSDEMGQMCTHMGAGAPGFAEQSIRFHRTADRIAESARTKERAKVLDELGTTLQTCTACHAVWKQRVVDDLAWRQVTAAHPQRRTRLDGDGRARIASRTRYPAPSGMDSPRAALLLLRLVRRPRRSVVPTTTCPKILARRRGRTDRLKCAPRTT
jgi:hypothetical protein